MQIEQLKQLLSSNSILRSTFPMLYLKEDNVGAFHTLLGTELHVYLWAHLIPEQVLSKGDCVESGYSEVMIVQFILNCRLLKESANVCWAHVVFNFIHENSYVL